MAMRGSAGDGHSMHGQGEDSEVKTPLTRSLVMEPTSRCLVTSTKS